MDCNEGDFGHTETTPSGQSGGWFDHPKPPPATPNAFEGGFGHHFWQFGVAESPSKGLRSGSTTLRRAVGMAETTPMIVC
jgi:hypothetical protein